MGIRIGRRRGRGRAPKAGVGGEAGVRPPASLVGSQGNSERERRRDSAAGECKPGVCGGGVRREGDGNVSGGVAGGESRGRHKRNPGVAAAPYVGKETTTGLVASLEPTARTAAGTTAGTPCVCGGGFSRLEAAAGLVAGASATMACVCAKASATMVWRLQSQKKRKREVWWLIGRRDVRWLIGLSFFF